MGCLYYICVGAQVIGWPVCLCSGTDEYKARGCKICVHLVSCTVLLHSSCNCCLQDRFKFNIWMWLRMQARASLWYLGGICLLPTSTLTPLIRFHGCVDAYHVHPVFGSCRVHTPTAPCVSSHGIWHNLMCVCVALLPNLSGICSLARPY